MEPTCPICLNPIPESKINTLSCGHSICEECISKFIEFNNKCPICNKTFLNFKSKKDNQIHELTKENLTNINNNKKEIQLNENFECITIEDIDQQIKYIKSKTDYLYNKLFGPRNEQGSDKENEILQGSYEKINEIKDMKKDEEINFKKINEIIDKMIVGLKKVENREYKDYIEQVDNKMEFQIEYCTNKKKKKKKHK